jgi:hypothetical protein
VRRKAGKHTAGNALAISRANLSAYVTLRRKNLSRQAKTVLQQMKDAEDREDYENAEILKEGRQRAALGEGYVSSGVLDELLHALYLRAEAEMGSKIERFTISGDARRFLETGDISLDL